MRKETIYRQNKGTVGEKLSVPEKKRKREKEKEKQKQKQKSKKKVKEGESK